MDAAAKEMEVVKKTDAVMEKNRGSDKIIIVEMAKEMVVAADKTKCRAKI